MLQDLENLLNESRALLASPDLDLEQLQEWSERRALLFARLQEADAQVAEQDRPEAVRLIEDLLNEDAAVQAMLNERLGRLGRQLVAVGKMRRALKVDPLSHPASVLQRFV
jgi:flagellar biosynthesis/type III secretory pathway chaperone